MLQWYFFLEKNPKIFSAWKFFDDEMKADKNNCAFINSDGPLSDDSLHVERQLRITFEKLFWEVWEQKGYKLPSYDTKQVYMFEISTERQQLIIAGGYNNKNK